MPPERRMSGVMAPSQTFGDSIPEPKAGSGNGNLSYGTWQQPSNPVHNMSVQRLSAHDVLLGAHPRPWLVPKFGRGEPKVMPMPTEVLKKEDGAQRRSQTLTACSLASSCLGVRTQERAGVIWRTQCPPSGSLMRCLCWRDKRHCLLGSHLHAENETSQPTH